MYLTFHLEKKLLCLCYCRIWIRTQGLCCPSFTACTASSVVASLSVWWWWTTCCRVPSRCTTSTTWRVPRTNAVPHARSMPSPHPRSKTWTSRRCMRACASTRTPTMPWWRPCRGTVGCVHTKICSVNIIIFWLNHIRNSSRVTQVCDCWRDHLDIFMYLSFCDHYSYHKQNLKFNFTGFLNFY